MKDERNCTYVMLHIAMCKHLFEVQTLIYYCFGDCIQVCDHSNTIAVLSYMAIKSVIYEWVDKCILCAIIIFTS